MRNGWDKNAHWAYFDIGPWGRAHQHHDALNITVSAYGRDLLVDAGRYTYNKHLKAVSYCWRAYFVGSASHNVILIDGHGQNPGDRLATKPIDKGNYLITPKFDFARTSFKHGFSLEPESDEIALHKSVDNYKTDENLIHTRNVVYIRDKFWVVVDQIESEKPRKIEALWHYHPDCSVKIQNKSVASVDAEKGNLGIIPVSNINWKVNLIKGQTEPIIQGWYSPDFNVKIPNTAAVFSSSINNTETFCWILIPAEGEVPFVETEIIEISKNRVAIVVDAGNDGLFNIDIPVKSGYPLINYH